jgi:FMN phosphatase YigB (HAD superfamily)
VRAYSFHQSGGLVPAVIEHCRAHGMQTALVTSALKSMIEQVIPQLEIHDLFDHTICADATEPCVRASPRTARDPVIARAGMES